ERDETGLGTERRANSEPDFEADFALDSEPNPGSTRPRGPNGTGVPFRDYFNSDLPAHRVRLGDVTGRGRLHELDEEALTALVLRHREGVVDGPPVGARLAQDERGIELDPLTLHEAHDVEADNGDLGRRRPGHETRAPARRRVEVDVRVHHLLNARLRVLGRV